jgi:hypothetical protein
MSQHESFYSLYYLDKISADTVRTIVSEKASCKEHVERLSNVVTSKKVS